MHDNDDNFSKPYTAFYVSQMSHNNSNKSKMGCGECRNRSRKAVRGVNLVAKDNDGSYSL